MLESSGGGVLFGGGPHNPLQALLEGLLWEAAAGSFFNARNKKMSMGARPGE